MLVQIGLCGRHGVVTADPSRPLFKTWGNTELCLYVVMLETGTVRTSVILDEVRRCTSTKNQNQHQLGGYILVSYEGYGIAIL